MTNPKVSIILPVYNGEKTIKATIESLVGQTYSDFELIVCIDGTNDASEAIISAFNDSRIKVLKNTQNLGLSRTLNRLIFSVSDESEYIGMAEQDDWYYPDRLQAQVDFLDSNLDYGLVSGISEFWTGDDDNCTLFPALLAKGGQYPSDYKECFLLNYRRMSKLAQTCMMFRKSVYIESGMYFNGQFPTIHSDWDFVLRFCKYAPIFGLNKILVRKDRRKDRDSITTKLKRTYESGYELIHNFRFEFKDIVTSDDYKFARLSIKMLELGHMKFIRRLFFLVWLFVITRGHQVVRERFELEYLRVNKRLKRQAYINNARINEEMADEIKYMLNQQNRNK